MEEEVGWRGCVDEGSVLMKEEIGWKKRLRGKHEIYRDSGTARLLPL